MDSPTDSTQVRKSRQLIVTVFSFPSQQEGGTVSRALAVTLISAEPQTRTGGRSGVEIKAYASFGLLPTPKDGEPEPTLNVASLDGGADVEVTLVGTDAIPASAAGYITVLLKESSGRSAPDSVEDLLDLLSSMRSLGSFGLGFSPLSYLLSRRERRPYNPGFGFGRPSQYGRSTSSPYPESDLGEGGSRGGGH